VNIDINKIRKDFPILNQKIYKKPLIYLDNAATTQKPQQVIDAETKVYQNWNSNIHRGVHFLSDKMTKKYERSRENIQRFINAKHSHEIIFTSGTTFSINAVAFSFGEKYIFENDEIIVTEMEHHANIVAWQMLCDRKNAKLKVLPIDDNGDLMISELEKLIGPKTKIIAFTHVSNTLGTINQVKEITKIAHKNNIPVLIDGAQAIQHSDVDVQDLDCDFYVFSGHKLYAPTGIGILYGKEKWLNAMPPYQGGGDMIEKVSFEKTTFNKLPFKFEAGTTNYAGAVGLSEAINYIKNIGLEEISIYETQLLEYATQKLSAIPELEIYGKSQNKISVISFLLKNIHHYDTGLILDKLGIAVRTGHHCTQPLMDRLNIDGTVRASFSFFNTYEEIDILYDALLRVVKMFN
jgi:cysteine desulfurase / selenocysteine lyase